MARRPGRLLIFEARRFLGLSLPIALANCGNPPPMAPPSVTLEIGGADFPMNSNPQGPPPAGALAEPPLNLSVPAGPLPVPGSEPGPPRSGQYAGTGTVTNDPLGECTSPIRIRNWFVSRSQVNFGAFSGTIQQDGSLAMETRHTYISGRFIGSRFEGRVWQGIGVGCQYLISLQPVA